MAPGVDALGGYRPLPETARLVSVGVFVLLLCVVALLERLQYRMREQEPSRWWASNGRDVVNVFALAMMAVGLFVIGFDGPLAFGIAASFVILLSAVQGALERHPNAVLLSVLTALVLGFPILFAPARLADAYRGLVVTLFP